MDWKNRSAYVFVKATKGKAHDVWQRFQTWDNMIGTWIIDGDYDVIAWFDATDWDTVHKCVTEIKNWNEVEYTKSHMVYDGFKHDNWWWWEKPAGTWVTFRENKHHETPEKIRKWNWMTNGASIPGEWDYISWVSGENWDEVWNHLFELKKENWETYNYVPIKTWWNQNWKNNWW